MLATDVTKLFLSHLNTGPTTTQKAVFTGVDIFTRMLRIMLRAIGIEIRNLYWLVGNAVKQVNAANC